MKWLAQSTIYRDSVDLVLIDEYGPHRAVARPVEFIMDTQDANTVIEQPTLSLPPNSARSLLQALWDAGIRPTEWSSPAGELKALRDHVGFAEHVAKSLLTRPSQT